MEVAVLRCSKCNSIFRVLEDERYGHSCPHCGFGKNESVGSDYLGDEIFMGDSIVIDSDKGEVILEDNLKDYLIEVYGFKFMEAK